MFETGPDSPTCHLSLVDDGRLLYSLLININTFLSHRYTSYVLQNNFYDYVIYSQAHFRNVPYTCMWKYTWKCIIHIANIILEETGISNFKVHIGAPNRGEIKIKRWTLTLCFLALSFIVPP